MAAGYVIPLAIPGGGAAYATPERNREASQVAGTGYIPSQNPTQTGVVGNLLNGKTTLVLLAVIGLLLVLKWK